MSSSANVIKISHLAAFIRSIKASFNYPYLLEIDTGCCALGAGHFKNKFVHYVIVAKFKQRYNALTYSRNGGFELHPAFVNWTVDIVKA